MKRWTNWILFMAFWCATAWLTYSALKLDKVLAAQSGSLRGHASMRGASVFGLAGCNPFVMVCQGTPVTITSAQIIAGATVDIVPAQGSGTIIVLQGLNLQYKPGSMAFSADWTSDLFAGVNLLFNCPNSIVSTSGTAAQQAGGSCQAEPSGPLSANIALSIVNDNGAATGGNGSIIVVPIYTVVLVQ